MMHCEKKTVGERSWSHAYNIKHVLYTHCLRWNVFLSVRISFSVLQFDQLTMFKRFMVRGLFNDIDVWITSWQTQLHWEFSQCFRLAMHSPTWLEYKTHGVSSSGWALGPNPVSSLSRDQHSHTCCRNPSWTPYCVIRFITRAHLFSLPALNFWGSVSWATPFHHSQSLIDWTIDELHNYETRAQEQKQICEKNNLGILL